MNMRILKRSRKAPQPGDVFVFQLEATPDRFNFGRVVRTDATIGFFRNVVLIYLYRQTSSDKEVAPSLRPSDLLVPPIATNALPWSKGYFETVSSAPLSQEDVLGQHCFKDSRGRFFDADGRNLSAASGLLGDYGLHSYRTIDDAVSKALGIPLAAD